MRVLVLERFRKPSRRCDPARVGGQGDEVVIRDLSEPVRSRSRLRLALRWLLARAPLELLRACLALHDRRDAALGAAPELWRSVAKGETQRIACFSTKGFELAEVLARRSGQPVVEFLARGTQYFGEFAFELLAVIPYAYWLHSRGRLEYTISTRDTRCLYYFSPDHEERDVPRRYVPITEYPVGEIGATRFDRVAFPSSLDTSRWLPPPYKDVFRNERLHFDQPLCVVCNKANEEPEVKVGNAMHVELVLAVVARLRERYQVVYDRPRAADIVSDHQAVLEVDDIDAVERAFPDVLTIQHLHERFPDLTFNELQLRLFANCERFVSVLGGSSYLASWFGGTNVVYARDGWEVHCGAYRNWFHLFSGARVIAAASPGEIVEAIDRELLPAREGQTRP